MTKISYFVYIELFLTSYVSSENLKLLVLSDWGKGGKSGKLWSSFDSNSKEKELLEGGTNQWAVAQAMGSYAESTSLKPSALLALGDNFYVNGISSSTDSNWYYLWESIYLGYEYLNIPWYPVFGNHDYLGSTQAQLDRYFENPDSPWKFEAQYYTKTFNIPDGGTLQIIFTDTTTLAPSQMDKTSSKGGVSQSTQYQRISEQVQFISETIEAAKDNPPTWFLIVGHYPVVSYGPNGDTYELKEYLQYLIDDDLIQAYICGHDHVAEHLKYNDKDHFVIGAGSMADSLSKSSDGELVWAGSGYSSFGVLEASSTELNISIINTKGETVYEYTLNNPNESAKVTTAAPTETYDSSSDINDSSRESRAYSFKIGSVIHNSFSAFISFIAVLGFILFALLLSITRYIQSKSKINKNNGIEISESRKPSLNDQEEFDDNESRHSTTNATTTHLSTNESNEPKSSMFFGFFSNNRGYSKTVPLKNHRRIQTV